MLLRCNALQHSIDVRFSSTVDDMRREGCLVFIVRKITIFDSPTIYRLQYCSHSALSLSGAHIAAARFGGHRCRLRKTRTAPRATKERPPPARSSTSAKDWTSADAAAGSTTHDNGSLRSLRLPIHRRYFHLLPDVVTDGRCGSAQRGSYFVHNPVELTVQEGC